MTKYPKLYKYWGTTMKFSGAKNEWVSFLQNDGKWGLSERVPINKQKVRRWRQKC